MKFKIEEGRSMSVQDKSEDAFDARLYVARLRVFYQNLFLYIAINAFVFLVWCFGSTWYFWPGISMITWGLGIVIQSFWLGIFSRQFQWKKYTAVLQPEWEEERFQEMHCKKKQKPDIPRKLSDKEKK
jgi:hypothetical protein